MENKKAQIKKCVFDVDGVLNYYPDTWIAFVNRAIDKDFTNLNEMKRSLSYSTYRNLKDAYRMSGVKECLKVREGAIDLIRDLRKQGYYIIIVTSRPVDKFNSLMQQTTNWLKKNQLIYDAIFFSDKKHLNIIKDYNDIDFVVEDNAYYANDIAKFGYKVFLLENEYNAEAKLLENVVKIKKLKEIKEKLDASE